MKISYDRYDRDRIRFDLALRMMRHGAAVRTVRAWTNLSTDRLRTLDRDYALRHGRRSRAPRCASVFLESPPLKVEATTFASVLSMLGLVPKAGRAVAVTDIVTFERAEIFCQAYEAYLALYPQARISFEHAWFLLLSLLEGRSIKLALCRRCHRLYLADAVWIEGASCGCA